jgi:hypothetical protein
MMTWIVRIWCALNALVLAHALIYPSTPSSGAELGMLMFFLNFPSSILTGAGMNAWDFRASTRSTALNLWMIWTPFFAAGAAQWGILTWLVHRFFKKPS